jgi:hypothetical protein
MRLSPGSEKVEPLLRRLTRDFPNSPQAMAAQRRLMLREQQARVARFAEKKKKPRIVIRLDKEQKSPGDRGIN